MKNGEKMVRMAASPTPRAYILTAPYFRANSPPSGPKKYPNENTLKTNPFVCESQLNSAFCGTNKIIN